MRVLWNFDEAVDRYFHGDEESLRQAIEFHDLPVLVRYEGEARWFDFPSESDGPEGKATGSNELCSWIRLLGETEGCAPTTHILRGYFFLEKEYALRFIDNFGESLSLSMHHSRASLSDRDDHSCFVLEDVLLRTLWFLASDLDALTEDKSPGHEKIVPVQMDGEMTPKREKTLLRIIRALDALAELPERGATIEICTKLEGLGFDGPRDDTVREVLKAARALDSD